MDDNGEIRGLLQEIRDTQRAHLAEYQRVTARSLDLQERSVARQQELAKVYRRVVLFASTLVAALLGLLIYLLVKWSHRLFGV